MILVLRGKRSYEASVGNKLLELHLLFGNSILGLKKQLALFVIMRIINSNHDPCWRGVFEGRKGLTS